MALTTLSCSASSTAALIPGHSTCASPSSSSSSSSVSFSLDRRQALNGTRVCSGRRGACLQRSLKRLSTRAGAEAEAGRTEVTGPVVRTPSTPAPRKAGAGLSYKDAGVDIDAGSELVRRIAALTPGIGGFGGLFPLGDSYLVAGTDGVGTKLKVAFELDIHDTIGIDLVAMSVNDIVTSGAKPLFFLDYFACSHLDVDQAEQVVKGIVNGCRQSDCVLLGGETAEMPDFHPPGYYEVSGTAVGIVRKDALIDGRNIIVGDQIIGLASSGVHSNGFSLVRSILAQSGATLRDPLPGADGVSIGEALLAPTVIYVRQVLELVNKGGVKGIAHITGGGFTDNIPRILPSGLGAQLSVGAWNVLPIFKWLQKAGDVAEAEMLRTFNMGIGMVLVVDLATADKILATQPNARLLGQVVDGEGVTYIGQ